jgi:hypothetical protein
VCDCVLGLQQCPLAAVWTVCDCVLGLQQHPFAAVKATTAGDTHITRAKRVTYPLRSREAWVKGGDLLHHCAGRNEYRTLPNKRPSCLRYRACDWSWRWWKSCAVVAVMGDRKWWQYVSVNVSGNVQ